MIKYLFCMAIGVFSLTLLMACSEPREEETATVTPATPEKPVQGAMLLYKSPENKESLFHWTFESDHTSWIAEKAVWRGQNLYNSPGLTAVGGDIWHHYDYSGLLRVERFRPFDFGVVFYAILYPNFLNDSSFYYIRHTTNILELREHTRSDDTLLARVTYDLAAEKWHDFRVQVRGDRVEYFIDNSRILVYEGLKGERGGIGFWLNNSGNFINVSETRVQAFSQPVDAEIIDILQAEMPLDTRNKGKFRCGDNLIRWFNHPEEDVWSAPPWLLISNEKGETLLEINEKKPLKTVVIQPHWCRDILANGMPALAYTHRNATQVVSLQQPMQVIVASDEYRLIPRQLDKTPALELVGHYTLFDRLPGISASDQPCLPVVLAFDGKEYRESTRQYPQVIRAELNEALRNVDRTTGEQQKATALRALGNYVLSGEPYKGLAHIRLRLSEDVASWLNEEALHTIVRVNNRYKRQPLSLVQPGTHYITGFPSTKPPIELVKPTILLPTHPSESVSLDYVLWPEVREDPVRRNEALLIVLQSWFGTEVRQWTEAALQKGYMIDELFYFTCEFGTDAYGNIRRKEKGMTYCHANISGSVPAHFKKVKVYWWIGGWQGLPPFWLIHDHDQDGKPETAYDLSQIQKNREKRQQMKAKLDFVK
jgi:hypothetical protein